MNKGKTRLIRLLAAALLLAPAGAALAQWELDGGKSALNFVSIKNDAVAEVHSFAALLGYIGADGKAQLTISLDSVETLIEIRNERMREMLFETVSFPSATVTAAVDPGILSALAAGGTVHTDLALKLALHGVEKTLTVPVVIIGEAKGPLQVFTLSPVIINAADFGLLPGVAALQAAAGLKSISTAVPVTLHLVFNRAE